MTLMTIRVRDRPWLFFFTIDTTKDLEVNENLKVYFLN